MDDSIRIDDGTVTITDNVIANIAIIAAEEIENVVRISKNVTATITDIFTNKKQAQGVKVETEQGEVSIDISLELVYGCKIEEVATKVQSNIKYNVESMTGLSVKEVNVVITGLVADKNTLDKIN
ncbi:MAG: Asp23/Gls24 family envelope stress response protein [Ezakiella sp.]|nr:Asp23/Gls24 family envelope stress response protein [Ezakiella sp.]MDD7471872.1 Asp23/Gls24 family envelope stress response protein [Bacillota bacterium]MDY3923836.1 Asp23/Gls24 family envelope stress response protein [Ezakiella sp.]